MSVPFSHSVKAVLGPTNTGKTHLAVERLCGHSSGMIGFPLRLLAREVYDRVVAIKGAGQVALMTGEERILPPDARYVLGTMEALPALRDVAFVGIDEAQLGADPERGHMFTDRMLRARGREETMILGSASLRSVVSDLIPEAEIITRPRFSTLSYAGTSKLSRLPKRSAIVAFSAEEVYAIAELLRRFAGGAAVVMGSLSPRTRNAQVAMFEAGEVDYLVATDAIGMGLNLDVAHVAFASLQKFDGRRVRRLTTAEMAQIAGRAGRHQQDGSFGSIGQPQGGFTGEEIAAIEGHNFPPLTSLYWRNPALRFDTLDRLISDLTRPPAHPALRPAPEAVDLAVLRQLAGDPAVLRRADDAVAVRQLWDVCGLPDFEQLGAEHHSRTVMKLWQWVSGGSGQIDADWFAARLARQDQIDGDVEQLASRIAAVRTLCFIAQRGDWIAGAPGWAEQTQALDARLSDALHGALTQRFVDRRLALLVRDTGQRSSLPVAISADDGSIAVDGEMIGTLEGFQFRVDPAARASDHRLLLAAAERHLHTELARRAATLAACDDKDLALLTRPDAPPMLGWQGQIIAKLAKGSALMRPAITREPSLRALDHAQWAAIAERLQAFIASQCLRHAAPLAAMAAAAEDLFTPPPVRALLAALVEGGGIAARAPLDELLTAMVPEERAMLRKFGLTIGTLDIFHQALIKPEAVRWRSALLAAQRGGTMAAMPPQGSVWLQQGDARTLWVAGFRPFGNGWLRIDMAEKLARQAHAARIQAQALPPAGREAEGEHSASGAESDAQPPGFSVDAALATSLGLDEATRRLLLAALGFRVVGDPALDRWRWLGRKLPRPKRAAQLAAKSAAQRATIDRNKPRKRRGKQPAPRHTSTRPERAERPGRKSPGRVPSPHSPFAGLAALLAEAPEKP